MISLRRIGSGVLFISILSFIGCSRPHPQIENLPLPDPVFLLKRIAENRAALKDFKGAGTVVFKGPEIRSAVGLRIFYLTPDYLKLIIRGPMGIQLGELVLAGDYYSVSGLSTVFATSGRIEDFSLPEELGLPLKGDDLLKIFLPFISINGVPDRIELQADTKEQMYILTWKDEINVHRLWVDPYRPLATKELLTSADGDTLWFKELEKVRKRSDVFLPSSWSIQLGDKEGAYVVKLRLPKLWVNRDLTPADFKTGNIVVPDTPEDSLGR